MRFPPRKGTRRRRCIWCRRRRRYRRGTVVNGRYVFNDNLGIHEFVGDGWICYVCSPTESP